jgi:predicted helicase
VIGFVTNGGYMIQILPMVYVNVWLMNLAIVFFHLRGNQRTSGERSRQEKGKIFGMVVVRQL